MKHHQIVLERAALRVTT